MADPNFIGGESVPFQTFQIGDGIKTPPKPDVAHEAGRDSSTVRELLSPVGMIAGIVISIEGAGHFEGQPPLARTAVAAGIAVAALGHWLSKRG